MKLFALMWGAAMVFMMTGITIKKKKTPAQLSLFEKMDEDSISDISAYNKAIGRMWCRMSVFCFLAGVIELSHPEFSIIVFALACTAGVASSAWWQAKIEEKYVIK